MSTANRCVFLIFACTLSLSLLIHTCTGKISHSVLRKVFECPPCDGNCPELPFSFNCEPVLEAGVCACCYQCARQVGEQCGLATARCAKDLACLPMQGASDPLQAFIDGTAVCTPFSAIL